MIRMMLLVMLIMSINRYIDKNGILFLTSTYLFVCMYACLYVYIYMYVIIINCSIKTIAVNHNGRWT